MTHILITTSNQKNLYKFTNRKSTVGFTISTILFALQPAKKQAEKITLVTESISLHYHTKWTCDSYPTAEITPQSLQRGRKLDDFLNYPHKQHGNDRSASLHNGRRQSGFCSPLSP